MKKLLSLITVVAIIIANVTIIPLLSVSANAAETTDGNYEIVYNSGDRIIVSLGDSYSSGEGIDPFFGSKLPINDRINNADWLCHRSKNAWSGKLTLENSDGTTITMKDHRGNADTDGNWYFAAMSGAVTGNILDTEPIPEKDKDKKEYEHRFKKYKKLTGVKVNPLNPLVPKLEFLEGSVEIEPQLNVFQQLGDKKADYVTITMGGNDIDFTGIVVRAAVNVPFLEYSSLDLNLIEKQPISKWVLSSKLEKMVKEVLPITKERLEESYKRIAEKAGNQAHIIVAGYPKIISINSKNAIFTKEDAELINSKVSYFNDEIRSVVEKCQRDGINISFVSVEDKFGDYGAYYPDTNKELINRLKTVQSQDICEIPPISSYSIHPNEKGAEAYADCVQKEIERVEENRTRIWGQVVDVSNKPISGVKVTLTDDDNKIHITNTSDTNGNYGFELDYQEGRHYTVTFEAKDYKTLVVKEKKGGNRITINAKLKTEKSDFDWKKLYMQKAEELIAKYGEARVSSYGYYIGLPIVRLIDFDGNGIEELYCVYSEDNEYYANKQEIFGIIDDKVISLYKGYTINSGASVDPYVEYLSCDKKTFLLTGSTPSSVSSSSTWSELNGEHFQEYISYSMNNLDLDYQDYTINGKEVTESDYQNTVDSFINSGTENRIFLSESLNGDQSIIVATNKTLKDIGYISELTSDTSDIFKSLPDSFTFSSGVGGWATVMSINDDGTFTGEYHDSEITLTGANYPNGTVYICNFSGKFTNVKKVDDYSYSMELDYINTTGTEDNSYIENNIRYIYAAPYGFDNADKFMIYLPGISMDSLPKEFISWSYISTDIRHTLPSGVYGIYNVGGKLGFVGENENSFWKNYYKYTYGKTHSELQPAYSIYSHIVFWPEEHSAATLNISFRWKDDDQTTFVGTDSQGSGDYQIIIDVNEDKSAATINIISLSGNDLSMYGGTTTGELSAVYLLKK